MRAACPMYPVLRATQTMYAMGEPCGVHSAPAELQVMQDIIAGQGLSRGRGGCESDYACARGRGQIAAPEVCRGQRAEGGAAAPCARSRSRRRGRGRGDGETPRAIDLLENLRCSGWRHFLYGQHLQLRCGRTELAGLRGVEIVETTRVAEPRHPPWLRGGGHAALTSRLRILTSGRAISLSLSIYIYIERESQIDR